MIVIRVVVQVKPEAKASFIAHMQQEMVAVLQFEGCERFRVYEDIDLENVFLIYEEWQSQAHFDSYRHSDFFKQNGEKIFPMLAGEPDSAYFEAALLPK